MPTILPKNLQKLIDQAICNLWDPAYPEPDLSLLSEWLQSEAWDEVLAGLIASCASKTAIQEYFNDNYLEELFDLDDCKSITDADRLSAARERIDFMIRESMESMHVIDVASKSMPPALLCFLLYYHPQGGATIYDMKVCHSVDEYIAMNSAEVCAGSEDWKDQEILKVWKKSKPQRKRNSKRA